jgi:cytochrome P450
MPAALQMLGLWARPTAFLQRSRARYGKRFTLNTIGGRVVVLCDPDEVRQLFQASPEVVHPGEGARVLEPLIGRYSVILLDEGPHMEQRKLLLPAFHGERMAQLGELMGELIERELDRWPVGQPLELHPRLQRVTLEIILCAVFGLQRGARLEALRETLTQILAFAESPLSLLPLPRGFTGERGPLAWLGRKVGPTEYLQRADELIFGLIEERRGAEANGEGAGDGEDILSMLLQARHEDGSPMTPQELRDELMTALVAGHETTASELAWAFERLVREPAVLARLRAELDGGGEDERYLTAVVNETLRMKPVLPFGQVAFVKQPIEIGGVVYQPGVALAAGAYPIHHDPSIHPEPWAFRPERFLEEQPGTYTWIPFGGGRRRCLGASFAQLEMKLVLRAVLARFELEPLEQRAEATRRRSITMSPAQGARVILRERSLSGAARSSSGAAHPSSGAAQSLDLLGGARQPLGSVAGTAV